MGKSMKSKIVLAAFGLAAAALLMKPPVATATMDMQKKAKAAGIEVQNCMHCHGEKLPKKGASTLNDRGKWLVAEKDKKGAKEVDVTWLKDYKEKK
jgi:mono/diheme cytochrome c family protein